VVRVDYDSPAMLSRAQEARVREILGSHPPGPLPLVAPFREVAEAGGLMAYGPNIAELWGERVPIYVDRILKGARPGDLPSRSRQSTNWSSTSRPPRHTA